jgi:hypothetical protein
MAEYIAMLSDKENNSLMPTRRIFGAQSSFTYLAYVVLT